MHFFRHDRGVTRVVIIGDGFSAAMVAVQLRARGIDPIVVGERELGRGVAYANGSPELLLNTPTAAMSALPDRPRDFAHWLGTNEVFARRRDYGRYVAEKAAGVRQVIGRVAAVTVDLDGFLVHREGGGRFAASHVVLATGNPLPRKPRAIGALPGFWPDPYRAMETVPLDGPIALLGTGLTSLDVTAVLRARGYAGELIAISRRGVVPLRHSGEPARVKVAPPTAWQLTALIAWWRAAPDDLQGRLDAIRPIAKQIWASWSADERARFVRHVRPYWEAVRHRAPPAIHAHTASLRIVRGALVEARAIFGGGLRLEIGRRASVEVIAVAALINCAGPDRDPIHDPLLADMIARGLLVRDPLGAASLAPNIYAIGPLRIATEYESTAVGELRQQAIEIAEAIRTSRPVDPTRA